ncbi:MAG TPA: hypothetical protein VG826_26255 [Pirellulales bacterium]|nr:hypothetical protein [Pirellulales bacterium]
MHYVNHRLCDLASQLEAMAPTCDPDFDAVYEDLDREFAYLRLHRDDTDGGAYA